jgi:hypothetical protein
MAQEISGITQNIKIILQGRLFEEELILLA